MYYWNPLNWGLCRKDSDFSSENTLVCGKVEIDQNPPITNQEWREWQIQDKTIVEITNLLHSKELSQWKEHNNELLRDEDHAQTETSILVFCTRKYNSLHVINHH